VQPAQPAGAGLRGVPKVIDTGTLEFKGRVVRLLGVQGEGGRMARQLARHLRRREIACEPVAGEVARCRMDGEDLSGLILEAGGGRATPDAPAELLAAEEQARSARLGIWRRSEP
jgi:endonuclease YncB( thermonuclease family)